MPADPTILVLTPWKDGAEHMDRYFRLLSRLTYPAKQISLGFLEGDSSDDTNGLLAARLDELRARYRRVQLWKRDYGFHIPEGVPRWEDGFQLPRRAILAKSRNYLLVSALSDEDWVLWIDSDLEDYPAAIVETLLAYDLHILHPHCVKKPGGPTFDLNAWRDNGEVHMDQLRGSDGPVRLDAVGGTMLLVRADIHREGLIFPTFPYGPAHPAARRHNPMLPDGMTGEIETEGLGLMAQDMGYQCWGLPDLEIVHH